MVSNGRRTGTQVIAMPHGKWWQHLAQELYTQEKMGHPTSPEFKAEPREGGGIRKWMQRWLLREILKVAWIYPKDTYRKAIWGEKTTPFRAFPLTPGAFKEIQRWPSSSSSPTTAFSTFSWLPPPPPTPHCPLSTPQYPVAKDTKRRKELRVSSLVRPQPPQLPFSLCPTSPSPSGSSQSTSLIVTIPNSY